MADRLPQLITVMAKNILPTEEKPHYYYFRVLVTPRTLGDHCTIKDTLLMAVPLNDVNVAFFHEFYSTKVYSDDLEQYNIERIKDAYPKLYTLLMMSAEDAALEYYVSEAFINGELHIDSWKGHSALPPLAKQDLLLLVTILLPLVKSWCRGQFYFTLLDTLAFLSP